MIRLFIVLILPFSCGYYLSYLYRSANAVIVDDLVSEFGMSAAQTGLLASLYFIAFASAQIPLGVLLDKYRPWLVNACLLPFACLGAFLYYSAESYYVLALGRFCIGLGVSACLMSSFKAIALLFPHDKIALGNGTMLAVGGLGAISASVPFEIVTNIYGWRYVYLALCVLSILVVVMMLTYVPRGVKSLESYDDTKTETSMKEQFGEYLQIIYNREYMLMVLAAVLTIGGYTVFQTLWVVPWLIDTYDMSIEEASYVMLILNTASFFGHFVVGSIASYIQGRGHSIIILFNIGLVLYLVSYASLVVIDSRVILIISCIVLSISGGLLALIYVISGGIFGLKLSGRANCVNNFFVFVAIFLMQYGVGIMIDLWEPLSLGHYSDEAYFWSLGMIWMVSLVGVLIYFIDARRRVGHARRI